MTTNATGTLPPEEPVVLAGCLLRSFLLLALLDAGSELLVADLVTRLRHDGFVTHGRPSKDVSDARRWEVQRGRARRPARSTYLVGRLPRQTAWRMRRRLQDHLDAHRDG